MSKEIKHKFTEEIVCPYCGCEFADSWEYSEGHEDLGLIRCEDCDKQFYGSRNIETTYFTSKVTYGECRICHKKNVVLENRTTFYGDLRNIGVECCLLKEENKLINKYMEKKKNE